MTKNITAQTLSRLPMYHNYLTSLPDEKKNGNISATAIAEALGLNDVQVRKDLASVSRGGRPKVGYAASELLRDISRFLGFDNHDKVIVAGMGNLGKAMLEFNGFANYGFDVLCGFDCDKELVGREVNGKPVYDIGKMTEYCRKNSIKIGMITVPEASAQTVCSEMAKAGIEYILNFSAVHLTAPKGVTVHNENISLILAMLARCSFGE
ncbi:MAG: redox-sensing transcriptional repressor Rex [Ruminococcus sp.]|nr:redox-sensing transcriptional repressor Rex [Ruminococcus sp.]